MVSRNRKLVFSSVAAAVLGGLAWALLPEGTVYYVDSCAQEFMAAVSSARSVAGRYPASLVDVERYLNLETQTNCSIQSAEMGQYYVEWQRADREECRLMVAYRVDAAGTLEEYNVHRVARKPD